MSEHPEPARSIDEHAVSTALPKSATGSRWRSEPGSGSPYARKFRTVTAVLVGLAVGAVVIAVAVAAGGRKDSSTVAWSSWAPSDTGTLGARDIADYVGPFYRISPVDQLAVVTVVNLQSAAALAAAQAAAANGNSPAPSSGLQVVVRPNPASTSVSTLSGNTIAYDLCGIGGKNCAIGVGQPSTARMLLLRREALELALYTFRYIGGVQNVVAILPPSHPAQTSILSKTPPSPAGASTAAKPINIAVLFVRPELQPLLRHPLSSILPEAVTPTVAEIASAPEAGLIDQVTARGLFSEQLQQAQDGSSLIVLNPLPAQ